MPFRVAQVLVVAGVVFRVVSILLIASVVACIDPVHLRYARLERPVCTADRPIGDAAASSAKRQECWRVSQEATAAITTSCRIDPAGAIECWAPQLRAAPSGRFLQIDVTGAVACAIREDGAAICWGDPESVRKIAPPPDVRFSAIRIAHSTMNEEPQFACGLSGELLQCWGERGTEVVRVPIPGRFSQIDTGESLVCGLTPSGGLDCWTVGAGVAVAKLPSFPGPFRSFDLGGGKTCAIDATGIGRCWYGFPEDTLVLGPVTQLRAGDRHACGLRADGEITCAGDAPPPPRDRFRSISKPNQRDRYCGIRLDGELYCWGFDRPR